MSCRNYGIAGLLLWLVFSSSALAQAPEFELSGDANWTRGANGVITADNGERGSLITRESYDDFELAFEFQALPPSARRIPQDPRQLLRELREGLDRPGLGELGTYLTITVGCPAGSPDSAMGRPYRRKFNFNESIPGNPEHSGSKQFVLGVNVCTSGSLRSNISDPGPFTVDAGSWHSYRVLAIGEALMTELDGRRLFVRSSNRACRGARGA